MKYKFPHIRTIHEVLPAIKDAPEFTVTEKEGYTVLSYFMTNPNETFPPVHEVSLVTGEYSSDINSRLRRECRGLVFCSRTGTILSRGYHKFFNLTEREETTDIDLSQPHVILEKLDGSMIRPLFLEDAKRSNSLWRPRWITKSGITEVSMQVEEWLAANTALQEQYEDLALSCKETGHTPIFEWCSRKQRIVLDYPEDQLILTAMRHNITGQYIPYDVLVINANAWRIPVVKAVTMDYLQQEGIEGIVIRFKDGHMVKVKTDWYVLRHKALDGLRSEKNVLKLILDEGIDDVLPLLDVSTKQKLEQYVSVVLENVGTKTWPYKEEVRKRQGLSRKEFADWAKTTEYPWLAFKLYDGNDANEETWKFISKNLQSQTTVDKLRPLLGTTWAA